MTILRRLAELLNARRDHFALQIAREGGKPLVDFIIETRRAIDGIQNAADELRNFAVRAFSIELSVGVRQSVCLHYQRANWVVFAISAFNHPLNLIVHQIVPAIAVCCPVIVKPAHATPLSCLYIVAFVHEAALPEDWCQTFIPTHTLLAEQLAADPRIGFLSFIRSAKVASYLHKQLPAPRAVRAVAPHAAPAIVDRSAELDRIIEPIVRGGYYHAGQVCVSTQRIFVHEDIADDFTDRLVSRVEELRVGDPTLSETEVGPLINSGQVDKVVSWVEEATIGGAQVAAGGKRISSTTMQPTLLLDPAPNAKVSREEIFGPVVCIYRYAHLEDAITRANSLPVAFQASVFANDIDVALRAAERLDASAVMINYSTTFRTDWMPFAGRR